MIGTTKTDPECHGLKKKNNAWVQLLPVNDINSKLWNFVQQIFNNKYLKVNCWRGKVKHYSPLGQRRHKTFIFFSTIFKSVSRQRLLSDPCLLFVCSRDFGRLDWSKLSTTFILQSLQSPQPGFMETTSDDRDDPNLTKMPHEGQEGRTSSTLACLWNGGGKRWKVIIHFLLQRTKAN